MEYSQVLHIYETLDHLWIISLNSSCTYLPLRNSGETLFGCDIACGCDTCERTSLIEVYKLSCIHRSYKVRLINSLCQGII